MAALTPAVSSEWLAIDSKANLGSGTTPYTPSNPDQPPVKVPYVQTGIAPENPVIAQEAAGYLSQPAAWLGNWPNVNLSQGEFGLQLPVQRWPGAPTGQEYPSVQQPAGYNPRTNSYENLNTYAGMDLHGDQDVGPEGWQNSYPTGRTARRQRFGDASAGYLGVQQWTPAERPTPARRALTAQAPIGGSLPPNFYSPAGQDTAYTAPAPPPSGAAAPSGSIIDPLAGGWA